MSVISVLADTFNFILLSLGAIANKFLQINYAIVTSLITNTETLKRTVSEYLFPFLNILVCYYQDFIIFLKELFTIARCIICVIHDLLLKLFTGISHIISLFQDIAFITHQNIKSFLAFVYLCVLQVYETAAYLVQLIFMSVLLILESGPNLLIFICKITLHCIYYLCNSVEKGLESFIINICDLCFKSKEVIFSVPIKAYFGILLFITIFYQYRVIIIYLKAYFIFLCLFLIHVGKQISYCIHICMKPVMKLTVSAMYKIKCIFMSSEQASPTSAAESNALINEENSSTNMFQQCLQKVKTFFNFKCYFHKRNHVDEQIEILQKELAAEREKHLCIICFDKPRTMILYPCRHMCVCEDCCSAIRAQLHSCPLCRRNVLNVFHVFT